MADNRMQDGIPGGAPLNRGREESGRQMAGSQQANGGAHAQQQGGLDGHAAANQGQTASGAVRTRTRNPAENLTRQDRVRGGEASASAQIRDQYGQFAGRPGANRQSENRASRASAQQTGRPGSTGTQR